MEYLWIGYDLKYRQQSSKYKQYTKEQALVYRVHTFGYAQGVHNLTICWQLSLTIPRIYKLLYNTYMYYPRSVTIPLEQHGFFALM